MAGSDMEKAAELARETFQTSMDRQGHYGQAFVETVARLSREHPNIVGIGVGLLVEQLLTEEQREYNKKQERKALALQGAAASEPVIDPQTGFAVETAASSAEPGTALAAAQEATLAAKETQKLHAHKLRPTHLAFEVFAGLVLLKFGLAVGRLFRRKRARPDGWLADAAKIHVLSASIATFYFASAIRSERISAWRNAAVALFATDAIKPLVRARNSARTTA